VFVDDGEDGAEALVSSDVFFSVWADSVLVLVLFAVVVVVVVVAVVVLGDEERGES